MSNSNVETAMLKIVVKLADNAKLDQNELYVVGNHDKLGNWDVEKAIKLRYVKSQNAYSAFRRFPLGTNVEFKVLNAKSWNNVEKGIFTEEIRNHNITFNEKTLVVIDVYHWN